MHGLLDGKAEGVAVDLACHSAFAAPFVGGQQGQRAGLAFDGHGAVAHATVCKQAHLGHAAPLDGELVDSCGQFGQGKVVQLHLILLRRLRETASPVPSWRPWRCLFVGWWANRPKPANHGPPTRRGGQ